MPPATRTSKSTAKSAPAKAAAAVKTAAKSVATKTPAKKAAAAKSPAKTTTSRPATKSTAPATPGRAARATKTASTTVVSDAPTVSTSSAPSPARSPRQQVRAETLERILSIAHDRLVAEGADALSLRSVARELGMVSSAVYRYVSSREDLLRLLAARAGDDLAGALEAAGRSRRGDASKRFATLAKALRSWALEHPGDFGLLYGRVGTTAAGEGATAAVAPGTGALGLPAALVGLLAETGPGASSKPSPAQRRELSSVGSALGVQTEPEVVARALSAWSALAGAVAVEVSGQLSGVSANPATLFDLQVDRLAVAVGLSS